MGNATPYANKNALQTLWTQDSSWNVEIVRQQGRSVPKTVRHHAGTMHSTDDVIVTVNRFLLLCVSQLPAWYFSYCVLGHIAYIRELLWIRNNLKIVEHLIFGSLILSYFNKEHYSLDMTMISVWYNLMFWKQYLKLFINLADLSFWFKWSWMTLQGDTWVITICWWFP